MDDFIKQLDEMFDTRDFKGWYKDYGDPIDLTSFVDDILSGYDDLDYKLCYEEVAHLLNLKGIRYIG